MASGLSPVSGRAFEDRNPANTDELVGMFPASTAEDVDAAVAAAQRGVRVVAPGARAQARGDSVSRGGNAGEAQRGSGARHDAGDGQGSGGDARRRAGSDRHDLLHGRAKGGGWSGQTTPSELRNKFAMSVRQPLGVCAMITPWNFPMAIPSWKIMPALVCGNTVVIKPAEDTPLSTYNLAQILSEAGVPGGVLNVVNGKGPEAGAPLVRHPGVAAVSFTGSTEVGRLVSEACAPSFKPCHLEMGGKNILIVMDDANLDLAVEGAVWAGFGTTGQRCTAASRVAVHKKVYKEFLDKFVARVKALKVGDGLDPATEMGPCINETQLRNGDEVRGDRQERGRQAGDRRAAPDGRAVGARLVPRADGFCGLRAEDAHRAGGDFRAGGGGAANLTTSSRPSRSPTALSYGLSASIYTRDVNKAFAAMRDLHTGIVYVNAPTIGAEIHLPFGGTKRTGNGHREAGTAALDFYSEWKTLYIDYSDRLQRAQMDS